MRVLASAIVAGIGLAVPAMAQLEYKLTDLGTLGGESSWAWDVNDRGQVVGEADDTRGRSQPFIFQRELAPLPTAGPAGTAFAVNNRGVAVGSDTGSAAAWLGNTVTDLGAGNASVALDINAPGQIVGRKRGLVGTTMSSQVPFLHDKGEIKELGTLGGTRGVANAINDRGTIVGWAENASDVRHAFVYVGGIMVDLTRESTRPSGAFDINNREMIVGEQGVPGGFLAVMWTGNTVHELGSLGGNISAAVAISDNGTVVGVSQNHLGENRAFVWTTDSGMLDLNDLVDEPGLTLTEAWGVNERGWVVGVGLNATGERRAFLAKPDGGERSNRANSN